MMPWKYLETSMTLYYVLYMCHFKKSIPTTMLLLQSTETRNYDATFFKWMEAAIFRYDVLTLYSIYTHFNTWKKTTLGNHGRKG